MQLSDYEVNDIIYWKHPTHPESLLGRIISKTSYDIVIDWYWDSINESGGGVNCYVLSDRNWWIDDATRIDNEKEALSIILKS